MSNRRLPPVAEHTEPISIERQQEPSHINVPSSQPVDAATTPGTAAITQAVADDDDSDWEDEDESTEAAGTESEVSDHMDEATDAADPAHPDHPPPAYEHHHGDPSPVHNPETCSKRFLHLKDEGFVAREGFFEWKGKTVFGKLCNGVIEVYRQPSAELVTSDYKDIDLIDANILALVACREEGQALEASLPWRAAESIACTGDTGRLAVIERPAEGPEWKENDHRCTGPKGLGFIPPSGVPVPVPCLAFAEVHDGKTVIVSACLYCQVSGKMCDFVVGKYQVPTNETVALVNRAELVARIKESADRTIAFSNQSVIDCCHRRAMDEVAMHLKWVAQQLEAAHAHSEAQS